MGVAHPLFSAGGWSRHPKSTAMAGRIGRDGTVAGAYSPFNRQRALASHFSESIRAAADQQSHTYESVDAKH